MVVVFVLLGAFAAWLTARFRAPRIAVSEEIVDFGELNPGERIAKTIDVANDGWAELKIGKVRVSCSCTTITLDKNVVPPRDKASMQIELTALGSGRGKKLDLLIESNDPRTPKRLLTLRYDLKRDSPLSEKQIYFGRIRREELPQTRSIVYYCNEQEKQKILKAGRVDLDLPYLTAKFPGVSNEDGFSIEVTLSKDAPCGEILSDAWVRDGDGPTSTQHAFSIIGYVRGDVVATPSVACLTPEKEELVTIETRNGTDNIEIVGVETIGRLAGRVSAERIGRAAAKQQKLHVSLKNDMEASSGNWLLGTVIATVRFDARTEKAAIPVIRKKSL